MNPNTPIHTYEFANKITDKVLARSTTRDGIKGRTLIVHGLPKELGRFTVQYKRVGGEYKVIADTLRLTHTQREINKLYLPISLVKGYEAYTAAILHVRGLVAPASKNTHDVDAIAVAFQDSVDLSKPADKSKSQARLHQNEFVVNRMLYCRIPSKVNRGVESVQFAMDAIRKQTYCRISKWRIHLYVA
jgi:hypothetical protein